MVGVGTGGTLTGLGRRLKEHDPSIRLVCIIPEAFPGVEGLKPLGRAEDIVPAILDEKIIDERVPVTVDEAYQMCVRLAAAGFFVGQSSGAYMAGVLAVPTVEYLPFAFFNLLNPLIAIIFGLTGFRVEHVKPEAAQSPEPADT